MAPINGSTFLCAATISGTRNLAFSAPNQEIDRHRDEIFEKLLPFFKRMHPAARGFAVPFNGVGATNQEAGLQVAPSWIVSDSPSMVIALPSVLRGVEAIVAKIRL